MAWQSAIILSKLWENGGIAFKPGFCRISDSLQVEGITRLDLLGFLNRMIDRGLGINRQYSILMCMKLFFKFCREVLHLGCLNPDREIKLPKRPKPYVHDQ
jgi:hypothetical protein